MDSGRSRSVESAIAILCVAACGSDASTTAARETSDASAPLDDSGAIADDATIGDASARPDALPSDAQLDVANDATARWSCVPAYAFAATRDPTTWPFAATSPFNVSIGNGAAFEAATDSCTRDVIDTSNGVDIGAHEWSQPVYVAAIGDPLVTLYQMGQPWRTNVRVPASAVPALPNPGDDNLDVIEPTHHFLDESWQATRRADGWDAQYWVRQDLYGPGCTTGGIRAYGGSTIAGEIRVGELKSVIPHALGFSIDGSRQKNGWVWPAIANDGHPAASYTGHLPMGQLLAIPPDVDLCTLGLSAGGLVVARALQDFGAYLVDSSGGLSFYAEPRIEDDATLGETALLAGARSDLATIVRALRCVTNNARAAPGGQGARRAPTAPPLP